MVQYILYTAAAKLISDSNVISRKQFKRLGKSSRNVTFLHYDQVGVSSSTARMLSSVAGNLRTYYEIVFQLTALTIVLETEKSIPPQLSLSS